MPTAPYDISAFHRIPDGLPVWREGSAIDLPEGDWAGFALREDGGFVLAGASLLLLDSAGRYRIDHPLPSPATALAWADGRGVVAVRDRVLIVTAGSNQPLVGPSLGEQAQLSAVAVHGDRIAVCDAGQGRVWLLDERGNPRRQIDGRSEDEALGFRLPSAHFACAWEADGRLLIANPGRLRVERWDDDGKVAQFGQAGMAFGRFSGCCNPERLAVLGDGRILTVEKGLPRLCVFTGEGVLQEVVAGPDAFEPATRGLIPVPVADGSVWVLDPRRRQLRRFYYGADDGP